MVPRTRVPGKQHKERRKHRLLTNAEFMRVSGAVAEHFAVSVDQMREPGNQTRPRHQITRQVVMYICWNSYDVDQREVGERFGYPGAAVAKAVADTEADRDSRPDLDKFITGVEDAIIQRRIDRATERDHTVKR